MISEAMMPIGTSRCGIACLFGVRGNRVEPDVREEDRGRSGEHAERIARRSSGP